MPARTGACGVVTPAHLASPTRAQLEAALAAVARELEAHDPTLVVDLGCGAGEYRHLFDRHRYLGLDLEDREFQPKLGPKVAFALADAHRLPLPASIAGFVLCAYAFDRFADPDTAMAEIARVLAPGGAAFLALPTRAVKAFDLPLYAGRRLGFFQDVELSGQTNLNYYRPAELARLAGRHGLVLERSAALGGPLVYVLKLAWLWWRLARYGALEARTMLLERLRRAPLPRSYRKRRGISVHPRRATRHARDRAEFRARLAEANAAAGFLAGLRAEASDLLASLDRRLFPDCGSEYAYLLRKEQFRA